MSGRLPVELQRRIDDALARRTVLLNDPHTDVGRLLNGAADNIPGLIVERYGPVLIAQLHEGHLRLPLTTVRGLCDTLREAVGATAVYRKVFPRDRSHSAAELTEQHSDPTPWLGKAAAPEIIVHEHGLKFAICDRTTVISPDYSSITARIGNAFKRWRAANVSSTHSPTRAVTRWRRSPVGPSTLPMLTSHARPLSGAAVTRH